MIVTQVISDPNDLIMSQHDAMATVNVTTDGENITAPEVMWSVHFGLVDAVIKVTVQNFNTQEKTLKN